MALSSKAAVSIPTDGTWIHFRWYDELANAGGPPTPGALGSLDGPFTFTINPWELGTLDVTDYQNTGDRFSLYDVNLGSLLTTSATTSGPEINPDPDSAFASPLWSSGTVDLGPGTYEVSVDVIERNPIINHGGAFLRVSTDSSAFRDDENCRIVMEAESYESNASAGSHQWVSTTAKPGFLGSSAMLSDPNIGANIQSNINVFAPKMTYFVELSKSDHWYLWARGLGESGSDNSINVGTDDAVEGQLSPKGDDTWRWDREGLGTLSAGFHKICVWMREDGFYVDRFILTCDEDFDPRDGGIGDSLPESSKGSGSGPSNVPPVVSITAPQPINAATVPSGGSLTVTALATDSDGTVTKVELYDNGVLIGTVTNPSSTEELGFYEFTYSPADGTHIVKAKAFDEDGAEAWTTEVTIQVGSGGGGAVYYEIDGFVCIEAESYTSKDAVGGHEWIASSTPAGASGGMSMLADPNTGALIDSNVETTSPKLTYQVNFTTTGTYEFWVRSWGATGSDDSAWLGVDGVAQTQMIPKQKEEWYWRSKSINISSPGVHDICIWMREDGFSIDKLILTNDESFLPSGLGPSSKSIASQIASERVQYVTWDAWKTAHFGERESAVVLGQDWDQDGMTNWQEYAFGTDPFVADQEPIFCVAGPDGGLELHYQLQRGVQDAEVSLEVSMDLEHWEDANLAGFEMLDQENLPNGISNITLEGNASAVVPNYFRLSVSPSEQELD